jgi:GWxTD domain-containing protein
MPGRAIMKRHHPSSALLALVLLAGSLSGRELPEKDLPQPYRDWLKLVSYIILPVEREVFLKLGSDRERDIFIESFWKQRDPTSGTPQNEFRDEHLKRFNYANSFYRRGTPREGWMTDMGRMHIILGAPTSIERFEGTAGIFPCQVWYYYGDKTKGLPTYFALVFFQRGGAGEFRLYNPTSDGPASLLIDARGIDLSDYEKVYEKIRELAPTLAPVTLSLIPGQYPYAYIPSPQNNIILSAIAESPKKNISSSYATHFLSFQGVVSTEYLTNYIESTAAVFLAVDPVLGATFCHFAISPKTISLEFYKPKDQYFCNVKMDVSLRSGQKVIFQYSKDFPVYVPPDRVENIRANGIAFQDSFPVIEGQYGLTVLLQNSVGKEFTVHEGNISVGAAADLPRITAPILGYDFKAGSSALHTAFQFMEQQLQVDPAGAFSPRDKVAFVFNILGLTEDLWRDGEVGILIHGLKEKEPLQKSFSLKLRDRPFQRTLCIAETIPAGELAPDYYEMRLTLNNGKGEPAGETKSQFIISPQGDIPHPVTISKGYPLANSFIYYYGLAIQYAQTDNLVQAEANFEKTLALSPRYFEGIVGYGEFLLKAGKYDRALEIVESLADVAARQFDYRLMRGRAFEGKGEYAPAIADLLIANRIYNSDTRVLNSLGFCHYKMGEKKGALDALNASLRLNPEQKEVQDLLARVVKELK